MQGRGGAPSPAQRQRPPPDAAARTLTRQHHCSRSFSCWGSRSAHEAAKPAAAAMSPRTTLRPSPRGSRGGNEGAARGVPAGIPAQRQAQGTGPRRAGALGHGGRSAPVARRVQVGVERDGGAVAAQVVPGRLGRRAGREGGREGSRARLGGCRPATSLLQPASPAPATSTLAPPAALPWLPALPWLRRRHPTNRPRKHASTQARKHEPTQARAHTSTRPH